MAGRPPRSNRNPLYSRIDREGDNPPPARVNLSREDLMAIATIVATTLQGLGGNTSTGTHTNQPPPPPPPNGTKYYYESLRKNRCPTFQGSSDPEAGNNWLKNVETQLRLLEIPNGLKVDVVTPFLEGRANKCWETVSPAMEITGEITWQRFREAFLKQYYPADVKLQKLSEFENLSQAEMSVMDYTSKFNDLGTYAPTVMTEETMKMHRFKKGLSSRIQSALAIYQATSFADLMGAAIRAETDIKRREEEMKKKRPMNNQPNRSAQQLKKPNQSGEPPRGPPNSSNY